MRRAALAMAALLACAAPASGDDGSAERRASFWYGGHANLRYVFRSTGGDAPEGRETDQDLVQDLFVEGGKGPFRFEASGRVREDIDGRPGVSVFRDIYDTYGDPATALLYTAYGEALDQGPLGRIRLGRQYYGEGVEVRFDGGLVETAALGDVVKLTAYGGIPVHLFESSARRDWLTGGAAELVAIPRTIVRLDYAHVTDFRRDLERAERRDGVPRDALRDDDYFQLSVVHRLTRELRLRGQASTFEGRSSRFEVEALHLRRDIDLTARARYALQVGAYRDLSIQFTPLDEVLGEYEPYHEVYADLRKGIGEHFSLGGGAAIRELQHEDDEGPFNHEFTRFFASADATDWPWKGLVASLLGEIYRSDAADRTFQVSGDVTQEVGAFAFGAGTSFALYKFDDFFLEERERVRTYSASVEWRPLKWLRPRIAYSFEKDDEDEYHVARFDLRIAF